MLKLAALGRSAHLDDWQGLSDQARSLEPTHRTHGREAIPVRALLPLPPTAPAQPLPETEGEIERMVETLRRTIRLSGLAFATEETYVHWSVRFTRFCLECLGQTPLAGGPAAITAYLDYLDWNDTSPPPPKNRLSMRWSS